VSEPCLCRQDFAERHPHHVFVGPCVHEELAAEQSAAASLRIDLARVRAALERIARGDAAPGRDGWADVVALVKIAKAALSPAGDEKET